MNIKFNSLNNVDTRGHKNHPVVRLFIVLDIIYYSILCIHFTRHDTSF